MRLKEDYKNDVFSGKRKYLLTQNEDKTISLDDATRYEQEGDIFTASDINTTNRQVNEMDNTVSNIAAETGALSKIVESFSGEKVIKIIASKWGQTLPYTQEVQLTGITYTDIPIIALRMLDPLNSVTVKAQKLAFSYVDRAVTGAGKITFYAYEKKPAIDISVSVKGG